MELKMTRKQAFSSIVVIYSLLGATLLMMGGCGSLRDDAFGFEAGRYWSNHDRWTYLNSPAPSEQQKDEGQKR